MMTRCTSEAAGHKFTSTKTNAQRRAQTRTIKRTHGRWRQMDTDRERQNKIFTPPHVADTWKTEIGGAANAKWTVTAQRPGRGATR
jgi:hypothetical protein